MYLPPHFAETRPEPLHHLMRTHPLGMLVTPGPDGPEADHLPFELDAHPDRPLRLLAHVARANPLWQRCPDGTPVLVVFRGAESYISPGSYPSKAETHRQVPTWNYEVVHAHGVISIHDDERYVRGVVARLTRRHEASQPRPWRIGDAAPDYIDSLLGLIVGIEVAVTSLIGKSKLSQNKDARDRLGAVEGLEGQGQGQAELAAAMRRAG